MNRVSSINSLDSISTLVCCRIRQNSMVAIILLEVSRLGQN
ncbi:MAG: hypothetical protein NTX48_05080 [Planctomycetales bacterium]|nr:hypothetical protein [Planctomycetales bacterium]